MELEAVLLVRRLNKWPVKACMKEELIEMAGRLDAPCLAYYLHVKFFVFNSKSLNSLFWQLFALKYRAINVCKWLAITFPLGADAWEKLRLKTASIVRSLLLVPALQCQHMLVNRGLWPLTPRNAAHAFHAASQQCALPIMKYLHQHALGGRMRQFINYEACYNKGMMVTCAEKVDSPVHEGLQVCMYLAHHFELETHTIVQLLGLGKTRPWILQVVNQAEASRRDSAMVVKPPPPKFNISEEVAEECLTDSLSKSMEMNGQLKQCWRRPSNPLSVVMQRVTLMFGTGQAGLIRAYVGTISMLHYDLLSKLIHGKSALHYVNDVVQVHQVISLLTNHCMYELQMMPSFLLPLQGAFHLLTQDTSDKLTACYICCNLQ